MNIKKAKRVESPEGYVYKNLGGLFYPVWLIANSHEEMDAIEAGNPINCYYSVIPTLEITDALASHHLAVQGTGEMKGFGNSYALIAAVAIIALSVVAIAAGGL